MLCCCLLNAFIAKQSFKGDLRLKLIRKVPPLHYVISLSQVRDTPQQPVRNKVPNDQDHFKGHGNTRIRASSKVLIGLVSFFNQAGEHIGVASFPMAKIEPFHGPRARNGA